jgi:hypothetical protein
MTGLYQCRRQHMRSCALHSSLAQTFLKIITKSCTFYVPVGSLPSSHQSATGLYPEPNDSSPCLQSHFLNFFLILSSHLSLYIKIVSSFCHVNKIPYAILIFSFPPTCHVCFIFLDNITIITSAKTANVKLFITQFSPDPCYLHCFIPKYYLQHPTLERPQCTGKTLAYSSIKLYHTSKTRKGMCTFVTSKLNSPFAV